MTLASSIAEHPAALDGDPEGLADLLTNLLSNAIRYTPRGGRVTLDLRDTADTLAIEVADTGIGIPAVEDLPALTTSSSGPGPRGSSSPTGPASAWRL